MAISIVYINLQFCRSIISKRCFFTSTLKSEVKNRNDGNSLVENQNDLELDFKVCFFSLLILVVEALYLKNPADATLASLSVLKYSRWCPKWPSVRLLRPI